MTKGTRRCSGHCRCMRTSPSCSARPAAQCRVLLAVSCIWHALAIPGATACGCSQGIAAALWQRSLPPLPPRHASPCDVRRTVLGAADWGAAQFPLLIDCYRPHDVPTGSKQSTGAMHNETQRLQDGGLVRGLNKAPRRQVLCFPVLLLCKPPGFVSLMPNGAAQPPNSPAGRPLPSKRSGARAQHSTWQVSLFMPPGDSAALSPGH